jgi:hypothetical protein
MPNFPCRPTCRICLAPGPRLCRASALAESDDIREDDRAALEDQRRAEAFTRKPVGRYQTNAARGWVGNYFGFVEEDPARV